MKNSFTLEKDQTQNYVPLIWKKLPIHLLGSKKVREKWYVSIQILNPFTLNSTYQDWGYENFLCLHCDEDLLLKCFDNGFSRVMWKIYKKHATNFQPSSPPTIWHTYNFCTEAQPHPSILFQAVSRKTKQHHLAAVFTSLTPLFLIQFFDWPWWNKLPPIIRPWSQRLPPTSKPHPNREKWADDTRIWKTAEHDNITGVWIYGPNRVALQAN